MTQFTLVVIMTSLMAIDPIIINSANALLCYRCDSVNQGETCEANPASRHIRNYGDEENCLTFEEVNTQYLALQKELDIEWYFSVMNGDHGIPVQLLRASLSAENGSGHQNGPFIHADRDLACLFVRSIFHHDIDEDEALRQHPSFVLWFRKCVQLPAMDTYPVCGEGNIYKGHVELCVCREDKCNIDKVPDIRAREAQAVFIGHHFSSGTGTLSDRHKVPRLIKLFIIKLAIVSFLN